jgi:hypothetical protein
MWTDSSGVIKLLQESSGGIVEGTPLTMNRTFIGVRATAVAKSIRMCETSLWTRSVATVPEKKYIQSFVRFGLFPT